METKSLVCVNCPMGCLIQVELEGQQVLSVQGNTCPKGEAYARQECIDPRRILTSTIRIDHAPLRVLPVITAAEIPLGKVFEAMEQIRTLQVQAPVVCGQVLCEDVAHTGVALLASRSMPKIA